MDVLISRPLSPEARYHFSGGGGGQKFVLRRHTSNVPQAMVNGTEGWWGNKAKQLGCLPFFSLGGQGGGWHEAAVFVCLSWAAPIGLSPLVPLTPGESVVVVVPVEPQDSPCFTAL